MPQSSLTPDERVAAFISDWHSCWSKHIDALLEQSKKWGQEREDIPWEEYLHAACQPHWLESASTRSQTSSIGSEPDHDPETEKVIRCEIRGDTSSVETYNSAASYNQFQEYTLMKQGDEWRIASTVSFCHPEGALAFTDSQRQSLLDQVTTSPALEAPPPSEEPNLTGLFEHGRMVKDTATDRPEPIVVKKVGEISLPSGALVVRDFGYDPDRASPLSLRVPSGTYPVELSRVGRYNAAVRILFALGEEGPYTCKLAATVSDGSGVIGVDAGNIAFADAGAFLRLTHRRHSRLYQSYVTAYAEPETRNGAFWGNLLDSEDEARDLAVVTSGHGDGGYGAYWLLNARQETVALVIDFLVAEF